MVCVAEMGLRPAADKVCWLAGRELRWRKMGTSKGSQIRDWLESPARGHPRTLHPDPNRPLPSLCLQPQLATAVSGASRTLVYRASQVDYRRGSARAPSETCYITAVARRLRKRGWALQGSGQWL